MAFSYSTVGNAFNLRWATLPQFAIEVADYLRISYATVIKMTKAGDIPALSVGREFRYLRTEIDKLLRQPASRTRPAADATPDHQDQGRTATG